MGRRAQGWRIRRTSASGNWYVRFTHEGQRWDVSTGERDQGRASRIAGQIFADVLSGRRRREQASAEPVIPGRLLDLVPQWLDETEGIRSPQWAYTCKVYSRKHWLPRWEHLSELTDSAIAAYIRDRLTSATATTVRKELSALRRFLRWAKREGHTDTLPSWETPQGNTDHVARALTPAEVRRVLEQMPTHAEHDKGWPVREYYALMWCCGLRRESMRLLEWGDISGDRITVRASADKRGYGRELPLSPTVRALLDALPRQHAGPFAAVPTRRIGDELKAAAKAAKVAHPEKITNHTIRHSRITDWATRCGGDLAALQYLAGHKHLSTTQRYVHGSYERAMRFFDEEPNGTDGD